MEHGNFATQSKFAHKHARNNHQSLMHQTLTQVLMPPIDIAPHMKKQLPPKSLLFKGKMKDQAMAGGSKTSRVSPKMPSELALTTYGGAHSPNGSDSKQYQ